VLHYVRTTQKNEALHIDSLKFEEHSTALELDQVTVRNLELVEPLFQGGQDSRATLFTPWTPARRRWASASCGRRFCARWWMRKLLKARYEAVGEAHGDLVRREEIRRAFSGLLDLERLLARLSLDSAGPRDVRALGASLARLPGLKDGAQSDAGNPVRGSWRKSWTRSKT
jgi:DNA mismatch repair protein MutS